MGEAQKKDIPLRLIEAAFACITEAGFAATSVSQIARAAGVDRSTFYHYFEGKDDLVLNGCIRHIVGSYPKLVGAVVVDRFETDIWFLYKHVEAHANFYQSINRDPFGRIFWNELIAEIESRCFPIEAGPTAQTHAFYSSPIDDFSRCSYHVSVMSVVFGFLKWWLPQIERDESHSVYAGAIRALRGIRSVHVTAHEPSVPHSRSDSSGTRGWESASPLIRTHPHG